MQLTEGTVIADRFKLVRHLGQGGMGAVWLAQHMSLDIPCAVKFLHAEAAASTELRARFEREAKAAAQLRSPNVVQILDHGVWEDLPYIAMELLEGEDLDHRLKRTRTLGPHETTVIIAQIARALGRAHAAGLVHRDLKPGNIFLVRDDDREVTKVLDFGIAKRTQLEVDDASTKTGSLLGTPFYMSPEQARGMREVDHRTDLWALGVITYRCLVGKLPFQGLALGDLFMKIIADPVPVPSQQAPVPPGFDAWWARAVARDPGQRFQSAKEMADALPLSLGISTAPTDPITASGLGPSSSSSNLVFTGQGTPAPGSSEASSGVSPDTTSPATAVIASSRPPAASRAGAIAAVVLGLLLLGGGAFVALRATSATSAQASTAQPTAVPRIDERPAPASASPAAVVVPAAPEPSPPPRASATATPPPSPAATSLADPPSKPLKPLKPLKPIHDDGI